MKDVTDGMWRESGDPEGVGSKPRKESLRQHVQRPWGRTSEEAGAEWVPSGEVQGQATG